MSAAAVAIDNKSSAPPSSEPPTSPTTTSPTTERTGSNDSAGSSSSTAKMANKRSSKVPSLFSAIWQPHKQEAQEKAKNVARTISFRGNPNDDTTKGNKRSSTIGTTATTTTTGTAANGGQGHGNNQLSRAQQKSLRRAQRESSSTPASPISPTSPTPNGAPAPHIATTGHGFPARPMSPTTAAVHAAMGHGPEFHQGMPVVPRTARYGYLEHSGRGLHLEDGQLKREPLGDINESRIGERVFFRARIHGTRALGSKLCFLLLRDGLTIIQGVVREGADTTRTTPIATPRDGSPERPAAATNGDATPAVSQEMSEQPSTISTASAPNPAIEAIKAAAGVPSSSPTPNGTNIASSGASTPVQISKRPAIIDRAKTQAELGCMPSDESGNGVDESMVRWAEKLPLETLVLVEGRVQSPQVDSHGEHSVVRSGNVHGAEVEVYRILVLSQVTQRPPFQVAQATYPPLNAADLPPVDPKKEEESLRSSKMTSQMARVGFNSMIVHRALALRTPHAYAIFRLVAAFSRAARSYLDARDFTEIHSAKLQQGASESGASVFHVEYFQRTATLAQSPQLAKEMCIGADFARVYEIGPVFRAEHSNTHRHLCEFTGLDVEMAIDLDYHEAMDIIDGLLKHMFRTVLKSNRSEIDAVKAQYPHDDLVFPDKTVVLRFEEGVKMLRASGYRDEGETDEQFAEGSMEDLTTRGEVRLGQLVKEKYNTDYYILDKFPLAVRPFYTMPDADNPKYSNAFDIFVRGEEILSGGQRLHSAKAMEASLEAHNIDPSTMGEYLEAFQFGMPPHAGGGIGLERLVMLFLKLGNIRNSTLIPRDPRSFPVDPHAPPKAIHLPVPSGVANFDEPNVLSKDPLYVEGKHPRLEDLIAQYGDSTNTAWTDKEYEIWRHPKSGFAVGFVDAKHHAVTWGPPLCPKEALSEVVRSYVKWCKEERKLAVIWANADERTEHVLVAEHKWRALAVTSEQRIQPSKVETMDNKHLEKKIRQAQSAGVTVKLVEGPITEEDRKELDEGMHAWMEGRKGAQIHTTHLRPWSDVEHRTYFIARDKDKKACGVIVLHQLAPEHGFQIKWSLMFPGAPNGTSELMVTTAMRKMSEAGVKTATFGAGAKDTFEAINGIGAIRGRILADVYKGISKTFGLTRKSHFREQFGTKEDSLYICYPPHGLGFSGINAIMESVKSQE